MTSMTPSTAASTVRPALKRRRLALALAMALSVAACATPPNGGRDELGVIEPWDPWEHTNRATFDANIWLMHNAFLPFAKGYRDTVPEYVRNRLRHGLDNLGEPLVFANNVAQGRVKAALTTLWRFVFNSTAGVAGLYDVSTDMGLKRQSGDFGQTLYVWGVRQSPYLVLPFFGPSSLRDGVGRGVDAFADPLGRYFSNTGANSANIAVPAFDGVDQMARNADDLETLERGTIDFYALLRSIWVQQRQATLEEGLGKDAPPTSDEEAMP